MTHPALRVLDPAPPGSREHIESLLDALSTALAAAKDLQLNGIATPLEAAIEALSPPPEPSAAERGFRKPIIGQEAICPDGLGRVVAYEAEFPFRWIQVSTYVNDRQCKWDPSNVELLDPRR